MTMRNDFAKNAPKEMAHGAGENVTVSEDKIRNIDLAYAFANREDVNGYKTIASGEVDSIKGVREATMHRDNSYTR